VGSGGEIAGWDAPPRHPEPVGERRRSMNVAQLLFALLGVAVIVLS
jgi:hypothetical protein